MAKLTAEMLDTLKARGYADDEGLAAAATAADGTELIVCASGELVTLLRADGEKLFSDSTDRLKNITVKTGLFKRTLAFERDGTAYSLRVFGGKRLLQYFMLLAYGAQ